MDKASVRQQVAASPLATVAALPTRLGIVGSNVGRSVRQTTRWLVTSREHTNITYNLTNNNMGQMAWFIAAVTGADVAEVRSYMNEVGPDSELVAYARDAIRRSPRRRLADEEIRLSRRIGWYALVRALKPAHVVETGTDKGLGTITLAAAVMANGSGKVTTLDINPTSGALIGGRYAEAIERKINPDSLSELRALDPVDLFLHDSLHTVEHEWAEYENAPLTNRAMILSDNAQGHDTLMRWAEANGRQFLFFREHPEDHWNIGQGIGAAWTRR